MQCYDVCSIFYRDTAFVLFMVCVCVRLHVYTDCCGMDIDFFYEAVLFSVIYLSFISLRFKAMIGVMDETSLQTVIGSSYSGNISPGFLFQQH